MIYPSRTPRLFSALVAFVLLFSGCYSSPPSKTILLEDLPSSGSGPEDDIGNSTKTIYRLQFPSEYVWSCAGAYNFIPGIGYETSKLDTWTVQSGIWERGSNQLMMTRQPAKGGATDLVRYDYRTGFFETVFPLFAGEEASSWYSLSPGGRYLLLTETENDVTSLVLHDLEADTARTLIDLSTLLKEWAPPYVSAIQCCWSLSGKTLALSPTVESDTSVSNPVVFTYATSTGAQQFLYNSIADMELIDVTDDGTTVLMTGYDPYRGIPYETFILDGGGTYPQFSFQASQAMFTGSSDTLLFVYGYQLFSLDIRRDYLPPADELSGKAPPDNAKELTPVSDSCRISLSADGNYLAYASSIGDNTLYLARLENGRLVDRRLLYQPGYTGMLLTLSEDASCLLVQGYSIGGARSVQSSLVLELEPGKTDE